MAAQANQPGRMAVEGFYDSQTNTISYLLWDEATRECAIIDSVLDYDASAGRTSTESADKLAVHVRENGLTVKWILETHIHADHLSAAPYLQRLLGGQTAVGEEITAVQGEFAQLFNARLDFSPDGSQFNWLLTNGDTLPIGKLNISVLATPGHTPACVSYLVDDGTQRVAFVGDTLFMPDFGTARCDFPGGDARTLYRSIHRILALPSDTVIYLCHDYQPGGRPPCFQTTVEDQRSSNLHVREGVTEEEFVALRTKRDASLSMPALLLPSVQVNMRGGELPEAEENGVRYLKIPLNAL